LPPEERIEGWNIPFEQYLSWEQARWLGFDVPEGSLVLVTPMAEGEPAFFLIAQPAEIQVSPLSDDQKLLYAEYQRTGGTLDVNAWILAGTPLRPSSEYEDTLAVVYPEMFDPTGSYGFTLDEIPVMVFNRLRDWATEDYGGFVENLFERVGVEEGENVLRLLGVTEEYILLALGHEEQEARINTIISEVFPDFDNIEDFTRLLEDRWDLFIETIETGGGSTKKRRLLELMGYSPEDINQMFSRARVLVDIDGVSRLAIIDIPNQAAYDKGGNYLGTYNPVTQEFTKEPEQSRLKDFWDWFSFQSRTYWELGENFMLSVLPEIIYPEMPEGYLGGLGDFLNETNRQMRENFRWLFAENKREQEEWVRKHPEMVAPIEYQEGAFQHPELLQDPMYYVYELANILPFILAAAVGTLATGGVGWPAIFATASIMTPIEGQAVYEDLINAGAPRDKAAQLALIAGGIMGLLESAGRIPLLKQISPLLFGQFKRRAISELAKKSLLETIKRFGRDFTISQFSEVVTEVAQEIVSNVAVSFYDENRSIIENVPDIAVKTAVATLGPSLFGAGVSVRMVRPSQTAGLTDAQMTAKGWLKDLQSGKWFEVLKGEEGFVRLPGEPEEVGRAERERLEIVREDKARVAREIEEGTIERAVGNKQIESLNIEIANLEKQLEALTKIPLPEPAMPEPGLQPSMFGEPTIEVRPPPRAEIVQISMDEQLKLEQARRAEAEMPPLTAEAIQAFELEAEIEGLRVTLEADRVAQYRFEQTVTRKVKQPDGTYKLIQTTRKVGLESLISIREQAFPEYFTVKQAQMLNPEKAFETYTQPGTRQYNKVPRDVVLDQLTKEFNMTPDEIADRVMAIRRERARIKEAETQIGRTFTEKPLTRRTELSTEEVTENWSIVGQPKMTLKQARALAGFFGEYVISGTSLTAWEMTRELRRESMTVKAENLKARAQELIVTQGLEPEAGMRQAISETLAGELPVAKTEYLQDMSNELRSALFTMIYHNKGMQKYPLEMASTVTALTNALTGKAIPRLRGKGTLLFPEGGSAWDRLNYVFGKQPRVMKAIDKMTSERKSAWNIIEASYEVTGKDPIPIDQEMADYLRNLTDRPDAVANLMRPKTLEPGVKPSREQKVSSLQVTDLRTPADLEFAKAELQLATQLAEGKITFDEFQLKRMQARDKAYPLPPKPPYEPPIESAIKEIPLWPTPARDMLIKILKEIGWSPVDIGNFLRANKASFDFSFWRQQAPLILNHPVSFVQANVKAWSAMWSQKAAEASWERISRDPLYQYYEQGKHDFLRPLTLAKGTAQWRGVEEFGYLTGERLIPRLTEKIPYVKISARAFITGANEHNWRIYKNHYKAMVRVSERIASGEITLKVGEAFDIQKQMDDFATMLADFTGRAEMGKAAPLAPALSSFFFAPRLALGRLLTPRHLVSANRYVRAEAWRNLVTFVGGFGGIVLMGAMLRFWEVERDPRSAEFMSIRIGNIRIDPWGGYRQYLVFLTRVITGTGLSSVTGAEYDVDPLGATTHFIRGKASPLAAIIADFWTGRTFIGEEVDVANKKQWIERIAPFAIMDIYEAYIEDPDMAWRVAIPAIVGMGVQTYTGDWVENWPKLGLPKYSENLAYGLTEPFYDTADFWSDTSSQFADVDPATLTEVKGYPNYITAIAEARIINEYLLTLPSEKLSSMNADPAVGTTFAQYYQMWRDREKLVAAGDKAEWTIRELQPDGKYKKITYKGEEAVDAFDRDERTRNAERGNFSQRQFALLNQYWAISDRREQAEFLKKHQAEIGINPRQEYLRTHPKENAELAIWGQTKILTREAFSEFNSLVKQLDIPDNALPKLTVPPETSWDTHIAYEEMVTEGTHGSVEAKLLLLKDYLDAEEAGVESYIGWRADAGEPLSIPDNPLEYYQLRVDNAELFDRLEEAQDADDEEEIEAIRATKVDAETFHDIERRILAIGKGTREGPIPQELVDAYVKHMRIVDETSGNSAEAKLNRFDNPDLNDFLMSEDYWGESASEAIDEYRIPIWRIDVEYKEQDAEYDALETTSERQDYLLENEDYRRDRRRREAYELLGPDGERFPADQIENFVVYYEIETKGKRQERFLIDHPDFAKAMHEVKGIDIPKPEDMPAVQYDDIYDLYLENFERLEGLSDHRSEHYIEDPEQRGLARDALRFNGKGIYTEFGLAELRRNGYGAFIPEQYIENYVGYYKIIGEGKPPNWKFEMGTDLWYDDDWFLMENIDFYRTVYVGLLGNERKDFTKVPSREVFTLYLTYLTLPHLKSKDDFRLEHRDLDMWLVIKFDYTPIADKKIREELTPYERFLEEWEEKGRDIEEMLAQLRE